MNTPQLVNGISRLVCDHALTCGGNHDLGVEFGPMHASGRQLQV
jgi:hypothetical protein